MCIITPFAFWDMRTLDLRYVCLQTYKDNWIREKVVYFLRKNKTLWENSSRILKIQKAKFSGHHFYRSTNIWRDFQICISVPLRVLWDLRYLFIKWDQVRRKLWIWSHLLKKSLMENFILCSKCIILPFFGDYQCQHTKLIALFPTRLWYENFEGDLDHSSFRILWDNLQFSHKERFPRFQWKYIYRKTG